MPAVALSRALHDGAVQAPGRPAISDGDRVFSRAEVDRLVDLAASRLLGAGAAPTSVVAVPAGTRPSC